MSSVYPWSYYITSGSIAPTFLCGIALKNARVIILDEATAYADPENEYLIQNAISKLVKGKTLIVVAHRLATIQKADQILVVENGKIVGCGRQEELLSECPLYQRLWSDYVSSADQVEGGTF